MYILVNPKHLHNTILYNVGRFINVIQMFCVYWDDEYSNTNQGELNGHDNVKKENKK